MVSAASGRGSSPAGKRAPEPTRRTALVIWSALAAGVLTYAGVAVVVGPPMQQRATGELRTILGVTAIVMSLAGLAGSVIIPRLGNPPAGASPEGIAVTRTIIAAATNEGAALFAGTAWMVAGSATAIAALVVSIGGLVRAFPSERRWKALVGGSSALGANRLVR